MQIRVQIEYFLKVKIEFKKVLEMVQIGLRSGLDRGYTRFLHGFDKVLIGVLYKPKNGLDGGGWG